MNSTISALFAASPLRCLPLDLLRTIFETLGLIADLIRGFKNGTISPATANDFEEKLARLSRELARRILEWTLNSLEPDDGSQLASNVSVGLDYYRRRERSAHRGGIDTLFGRICLRRYLYQPLLAGEPAIFPLEIALGIEAGRATPALALRAGHYIATLTQRQTLQALQREYGVSWSVKSLRNVIASLSESMSERRHAVQVARLLKLLEQANQSVGNHKIVLSVGRDGVFTPSRGKQGYQESVTATVAVYDRRGKRLGTVYLAHMPQPGQVTLSQQVTALLEAVLKQWDGPMPRLSYVTDAGHHPTEYFQKVLRFMRHPVTKQPLHWEWVIDFYHASGYLWKMAEAIFGEGQKAAALAVKWRHWLRHYPNGAFRALHSAAALVHRCGLIGADKKFQEAYDYLSTRLGYLDYVDYKRRGLPIGSGVTEAACKTVFTYRFKQSGMRWSTEGGQTIVDLRVLVLSGVWEQAAALHLAAKPTISHIQPTHSQKDPYLCKIAA